MIHLKCARIIKRQPIGCFWKMHAINHPYNLIFQGGITLSFLESDFLSNKKNNAPKGQNGKGSFSLNVLVENVSVPAK